MTTPEPNFGGTPIQFVQIGLGTNRTCIQNLYSKDVSTSCPEIEWLLSATTERRPDHIKGLSVEPIMAHAEVMRSFVVDNPNMSVLQVAVGEYVTPSVEIWNLDPSTVPSILESVSDDDRDTVASKLEYILNMSCVCRTHPLIETQLPTLWLDYAVDLKLSQSVADLWTWSKLVSKCNFRSCEILLVDAEGYDTQILRSVVAHCRQNPNSWPGLIQFETMGHCDELEGYGAEWAVVETLESEGYQLVHFSHHSI